METFINPMLHSASTIAWYNSVLTVVSNQGQPFNLALPYQCPLSEATSSLGLPKPMSPWDTAQAVWGSELLTLSITSNNSDCAGICTVDTIQHKNARSSPGVGHTYSLHSNTASADGHCFKTSSHKCHVISNPFPHVAGQLRLHIDQSYKGCVGIPISSLVTPFR